MTADRDSEAERVAAGKLFGDRLDLAKQFAEMLAEQGVRRGLIGPREKDRLWSRHLLNSAALAELLPQESRVVDVGSGAGFPGIPLALARPDIRLILLEPMARRISWLNEVVTELALDVSVERGRAEEGSVRDRLGGQDVVAARAVAPMARLASWSLPLLRPGGVLLAVKGESAAEELERDSAEIAAMGGIRTGVVTCGGEVLSSPATVVRVERSGGISPDTGGGQPYAVQHRKGSRPPGGRRRGAASARYGGTARRKRKDR